MQFSFTSLAMLGALLANTGVLAIPTEYPNTLNATEVTLETRDVFADHVASVNTYSGDGCSGSAFSYTISGAGASNCHVVSNTRSIQVSASNCRTTVWSGSNCRGSSFNVPNSSCYSVLYASVLVQC